MNLHQPNSSNKHKPSSPLEIINNQTPEESPQTQTKILKPMISSKKSTPLQKIGLSALIVLLGTVTGFGLSKATGASQSSSVTTTEEQAKTEGLAVGDTLGVDHEDEFNDSAEGVLALGGFEGEGSHRILREGGPARNVYITSAVIDLNLLIGHRVKVWGNTSAGLKAAWLMDVGRAEVLELDAPKPFEEETSDSLELDQ